MTITSDGSGDSQRGYVIFGIFEAAMKDHWQLQSANGVNSQQEELESSKDGLWLGVADKGRGSGLLLSPIPRQGSGPYFEVKFF